MTGYRELIHDIAFAAYQSRQYAEAQALLKLLFGTGWRDAYFSYFIGHLEYLQGNVEAAIGYLKVAVAMDPRHARSLNDLGEALRISGRHEEAVEILLRSIEIEPGLAYPYGNLSAAVHALNRDEEALRWLLASRQLSTNPAITHFDLGATYAWLNRHEDAIQQFRLAQELQPDYPRAGFSEGLSLLALGRFREGWLKHEARLRDPSEAHVRRACTEPAWLGEPDIAGRTILLHAEQGHGDAIQFVRYVPYVVAKRATVLLQAHAGLAALFSRIDGISAYFTPVEQEPPIDLQCSLLSLPYALRDELDHIPAQVPYLTVDPVRAAMWRQRLGPRRRMRVGIAWSGSAGHANDHNRSIPLARLVPLLSRRDIDFHVLQNDVRVADWSQLATLSEVHDHSTSLTDFMDTAVLATQMDLVITVDTSLAHLAGAFAMPVWLMLPWAADWRWMLDRSDTPWYRTMRLFRQQKQGDWSSVLSEIARALDHWSP